MNRVVGLAVVLWLLPAWPATAQQEAQAFRTAWGDPDLMGVWDFRSLTPLQRPRELAGKSVLTAEEAAVYQRDRVALLDKDRRTGDGLSSAGDVANAYNEFWWDYGKELTGRPPGRSDSCPDLGWSDEARLPPRDAPA